jgi:hypothetical protein
MSALTTLLYQSERIKKADLAMYAQILAWASQRLIPPLLESNATVNAKGNNS